jgi:DnaJ-class molecular chaperone
MSKPCTFCVGTGQTNVSANIIDLTIMRITNITTQVPCGQCHGKGFVLTEPTEIVDDLLQKIKERK